MEFYWFFKIRHGYKSSFFGETGLFQIFSNNLDFCISIVKQSKCVICNIEVKIKYYEKCLISINTGNINLGSLEKILKLKYAIGITHC